MNSDKKSYYCEYCGKEIFPGRRKKKKYCCRLCQQRGSARNYYKRMKENETFKSKAYERTKRWVETHRERHRELCLKAYRKSRGIPNENN